jgi:uncharacterized protein (DUF433 family)
LGYHRLGMDRITFNPNHCGGRPCIRGMRIRVKDVLDLLAAGVGEAEILEDYPYLEAEDIGPVWNTLRPKRITQFSSPGKSCGSSWTPSFRPHNGCIRSK